MFDTGRPNFSRCIAAKQSEMFSRPEYCDGSVLIAGPCPHPYHGHTLFLLSHNTNNTAAIDFAQGEARDFITQVDAAVAEQLAVSDAPQTLETAKAELANGRAELAKAEAAAAEADGNLNDAKRAAQDFRHLRKPAEDTKQALEDCRTWVAGLERAVRSAEDAITCRRGQIRASILETKRRELAQQRIDLQAKADAAIKQFGQELLAIIAMEAAVK